MQFFLGSADARRSGASAKQREDGTLRARRPTRTGTSKIAMPPLCGSSEHGSIRSFRCLLCELSSGRNSSYDYGQDRPWAIDTMVDRHSHGIEDWRYRSTGCQRRRSKHRDLIDESPATAGGAASLMSERSSAEWFGEIAGCGRFRNLHCAIPERVVPRQDVTSPSVLPSDPPSVSRTQRESFRGPLGLLGRKIAECRVDALPIVVALDVGEQIAPRFIPGRRPSR